MTQQLRHNKNTPDSDWVEIIRSFFSRLFTNYSLPTWGVLLLDLSVVLVTFVFSYLLRFNFEQSAIDFRMALSQSLIVIGIYAGFELLFRSNAGLIRHSTISDIFNVIMATSSSMLLLVLLTVVNRFTVNNDILSIPLSIILIHYVSISVFLFMFRILIKLFFELSSTSSSNKKNVIIYGAGVMGVMVKKVILMDQVNEYKVVAFIDRNKNLHNKKLDGISVYSPKKMEKEFLREKGVEAMVFAIMNIPDSERSEIYKNGIDLGLEVLKLPPVNNWLDGQFQAKHLKKVKVQDLLGREPIQMNLDKMSKELKGKTILVTGAAGSIGSEIVRQLSRFDVGKLILVDNAETPMFFLDKELTNNRIYDKTRLILGDAVDYLKMDRIFKVFKPHIVFHAAAYKHVPLLESNPHEAIRVNVGSTIVLTGLSMKYSVQKFVMVSTDKAVNPTNVMGASKRMCELIVQSRAAEAGNSTRFIITRFGNVLGSNGSVVPLFQEQIQAGGPVTVTHPEVTRYFMTISEACQLVMEAGFMGLGGEIFVFNMGEPVKIVDLAKRMIRLSGFDPEIDIKVVFTGLRPGEKLYEELLNIEEKTLPTYHPKVRIAEAFLKEDKDLFGHIKSLIYSNQTLSATELIERMINIVPEFQPSNERYLDKTRDADEIEVEVFPD